MAIHNNDRVADIPTTANNPASPVVMARNELGETEEIVYPKAPDRLLLEKAGQTASVVQGKKRNVLTFEDISHSHFTRFFHEC